MLTAQLTAEEVINHHLEALGQNELAQLMEAYTERSEVWTQDGIITGKAAISAFFSYAFTLFPKGKTNFEVKKMIAKGDKVYLLWTADSPVINISFATDCFQVQEGKIIWQSVAFQAAQK